MHFWPKVHVNCMQERNAGVLELSTPSDVVVWKVPTLMQFSPPSIPYGSLARIARASVLVAISLTTVGCRDQSYLQFPIGFTVAD